MTKDAASAAEIAEQNVELFRKLLIPEIFSKILRNLKPKDRLNMRQCCHDTEEAVARSDMHIYGSPQFIYLSNMGNQFQMCLGLKKDRTTIKIRMDINEYDWEEIARIRERLFKRAFAKYVDIDVDFKVVPFELVTRLLEGCFFEELVITISRPGNLKANVVKYLSNLDITTDKKVKLVLDNCRPKKKMLLSLKRLSVLEMRTPESYISEEILIKMCRRKHKNIDLPIVVTAEQTISEIVKILGDNPDRQWVKFTVDVETMERFVLTTGHRLMRDPLRRLLTYTNIIKLRRKKQEEGEGWRMRKLTADDGHWDGQFELTSGRVHVYVFVHCFISKFTIVIYNFTDPDEVQSEDDEDTVYF